MKRWLCALAVAAVAATWMGCQSAESPATASEAPKTHDAGDYTFVNISVPNMT